METRDHALQIGTNILAAMDEEFHDAPDRVLAVVGAAYLDSLLGELLRAVLISDDTKAVDELLDVQGVLGSHGARYQIAYCLGLITKTERDDLKMIARVRNEFAHNYDVRSFEHVTPAKHIAKLHFGKQLDQIAADLANATSDPKQKEGFRQIAASGRRKFQDTVRNLFVMLLLKLNSVAKPMWYPP